MSEHRIYIPRNPFSVPFVPEKGYIAPGRVSEDPRLLLDILNEKFQNQKNVLGRPSWRRGEKVELTWQVSEAFSLIESADSKALENMSYLTLAAVYRNFTQYKDLAQTLKFHHAFRIPRSFFGMLEDIFREAHEALSHEPIFQLFYQEAALPSGQELMWEVCPEALKRQIATRYGETVLASLPLSSIRIEATYFDLPHRRTFYHPNDQVVYLNGISFYPPENNEVISLKIHMKSIQDAVIDAYIHQKISESKDLLNEKKIIDLTEEEKIQIEICAAAEEYLRSPFDPLLAKKAHLEATPDLILSCMRSSPLTQIPRAIPVILPDTTPIEADPELWTHFQDYLLAILQVLKDYATGTADYYFFHKICIYHGLDWNEFLNASTHEERLLFLTQNLSLPENRISDYYEILKIIDMFEDRSLAEKSVVASAFDDLPFESLPPYQKAILKHYPFFMAQLRFEIEEMENFLAEFMLYDNKDFNNAA